MKRFRRLFLEDGDRLVRVKSWRPAWGRHGLEWPSMLIDRNDGHRWTISPVWDRARLLTFWK